jgi:hypothetical protein
LINRVERNVEIYSRKRLSAIEALSVAIISAMIVGSELRFPANLSAEKAARER